jgi:hypothetical protein
MDEEKKMVEETIAPIEAEVEETTAKLQDAEESETDAPSTSEVDAEESTSGTEQSDSTVTDWENKYKSVAGKMSKFEKENNELTQKVKLLEALDAAAANDPEFMKMANKKLVEQGLLDESVLQQLDITPQPKADGIYQDPAIKWAQAKMQEEQKKREQFFVDFEERHPELKEGDPQVIRANRSAIGAAAAKRMAEAKVSQEEAFEFAYKLIMNPSQLIEEGKLEGLAQAQGASPVEGAASGGAAKSAGRVELTPEQREAARLFGISEEEFANNLEE